MYALAVLVEQDVGGLDVAVNHSGRPQRLQPGRDIRTDAHRVRGVERAVSLASFSSRVRPSMNLCTM